MVMKWGLERADEKGLESYIEATDLGKPVYEKFGFDVIKRNEFILEDKEGSEWEELKAELLPFEWWSMHRNPISKVEK